MPRFRVLIAGILLATTCLSGCARSPTTPSATARHVFVIVMENKYSLLATVEDLLGVGRLGQAAGEKTLTDLVPS